LIADYYWSPSTTRYNLLSYRYRVIASSLLSLAYVVRPEHDAGIGHLHPALAFHYINIYWPYRVRIYRYPGNIFWICYRFRNMTIFIKMTKTACTKTTVKKGNDRSYPSLNMPYSSFWMLLSQFAF
jgi:hypothetical protein